MFHYKTIKKITIDFNNIIESIDIKKLPNGDIIYKNYLINKNNEIIDINDKEVIDNLYLSTSSLLVCKFHSTKNYKRLSEIKLYDNLYSLHFNNYNFIKSRIKDIKNYEQYQISLTKMEYSEIKYKIYQKKIIELFNIFFL